MSSRLLRVEGVAPDDMALFRLVFTANQRWEAAQPDPPELEFDGPTTVSDVLRAVRAQRRSPYRVPHLRRQRVLLLLLLAALVRAARRPERPVDRPVDAVPPLTANLLRALIGAPSAPPRPQVASVVAP